MRPKPQKSLRVHREQSFRADLKSALFCSRLRQELTAFANPPSRTMPGEPAGHALRTGGLYCSDRNRAREKSRPRCTSHAKDPQPEPRHRPRNVARRPGCVAFDDEATCHREVSRMAATDPAECHASRTLSEDGGPRGLDCVDQPVQLACHPGSCTGRPARLQIRDGCLKA